ncbi:MAG TPA: hypothetical protein V6D17_09865 [Candidatus Obscuribacterales bacterium]
MTVKKFKGGRTERDDFDQGFDDTEAFDGPEKSARRGHKPRNIQDTQVWRDSTGGLKKIWGNYLNLLGKTFQQLSREEQERYITRFSVTIAVGAACVMASFFYWFLPPLVRVLVVPVFIGGAWWAGARFIAPQVILRFEHYLRPSDY